MTRDDVVRMAREIFGQSAVLPVPELERLVAKAYAAGQAAEREACIEDVRTVGGRFAVECEALIHSRGNGEAR